MAKQPESTQLPLSVTLSPWPRFIHLFKKSVREFRYSAFSLVLTNILFWVNGGIVFAVWFFMQRYSKVLNAGIGVLFPPGSKSMVPTFVSTAIRDLTFITPLWYAMIGLWLMAALISMLVYSYGRYGMTTYILAITAILLVLMAKICLTPLILLGGN